MFFGKRFTNRVINIGEGSTVEINGKTYTGTGSFSIGKDNVIINGETIETGMNVAISIHGNVTGDIVADTVVVLGDVGGKVESVNGPITVGKNVKGDVETVNGDVEIKGIVGGRVETVNGDIYMER